MTVRFSTRAPNADYLGFEASPRRSSRPRRKPRKSVSTRFWSTITSSLGTTRAAPWTNVHDPFVALSFIAAHTTHIGVGVSVLIMPYRNPIATAKAQATLDRMSGGRLIAGVGVGWNEAEFAALGVPFHERGARTNEYLRLWQVCWVPGKVSFAGNFVSFADMHVSPKPLQQPHPPIWIGGASDAALRRAARFAAVWQPTPLPLAQLVERRAALRQACEALGREPIPTRMKLPGGVQHHHRERTADRKGAASRPRHGAVRLTCGEQERRRRRMRDQAAATATCHWFAASARKIRSVERETR